MSWAAIERAMRVRVDLSPSARLVLIDLAYHENRDTGESFPGVDTICEEVGRGESTVRAALARLRTLKLVTVIEHPTTPGFPKKAGHQPTCYHVEGSRIQTREGSRIGTRGVQDSEGRGPESGGGQVQNLDPNRKGEPQGEPQGEPPPSAVAPRATASPRSPSAPVLTEEENEIVDTLIRASRRARGNRGEVTKATFRRGVLEAYSASLAKGHTLKQMVDALERRGKTEERQGTPELRARGIRRILEEDLRSECEEDDQPWNPVVEDDDWVDPLACGDHR